MAGVVVSLKPKEGDMVSTGDDLARIEAKSTTPKN